LRSIKADKNHLKSINDLDKHAGVLSLRARDNEIEEADFARCQLARVVDVDLEGNNITLARNLHRAPALGHLKLARNRLRQLEFNSAVHSLKQLDISYNQVASIDLTNLPNLTLFHADSNRFGDIRGCDVTRRLDSLSLREQQGEQPIDMSFLTAANEVRKLYLSGNYLGVFEPRVDMLNLQLLELASCGLQILPANLGQLMPNLRSVNLNFNSIPDIQCLAFIPRLKKLLVAGNHIKDARIMEEVVSMFPHLTQIDTRDNPFTHGFYVPLCSLSSEGRQDPFVLPEADAERDAAFASRLIMEMKMRRRVHQIAFAARCKKLKMLDGLEMSTKKALAQDDILRKLMEADIVPLLGNEEKEWTA
jgi:Leucine-rich repeat (LRR) protein